MKNTTTVTPGHLWLQGFEARTARVRRADDAFAATSISVRLAMPARKPALVPPRRSPSLLT